jgi:glycerol-3-phosphate O-acyltransferase/dihydroxyacetone phosphate acyltransferase
VLGGLVGSLVRKGAEKERKKALAASSVKIHGYDVLASYKIVYGTVIFSTISVFLGLFTFIYSFCTLYLDYFSSVLSAIYSIIAFSVLWPVYMYLSIILSDRAFRNFRRLYMQTLTICSPVALESVLALRDQIKTSIKSLTKQYGPEVFPELKSKKTAKAKIEFNESINDAFGLLSEIGFS